MSTTIDTLIKGVSDHIAGELAKRAEHSNTIEAVRAAMISEKRDVASDSEADQVRSAKAAIDAIDADVAERRKRLDDLKAEKASDEQARALAKEVGAPEVRAGVQITEPRTYSRESSKQGLSFFADAYNARFNYDDQAQERLARHGAEVRAHGEFVTRAQTTGGGAGLVIPQYLIDQVALVARAGRPIANDVTHLELPDTGMSLIIPRGTTGAAVASQATENSAVQNTDEVWTNLTVPVVTVAGQQQVSRQFLERGSVGIDALIYSDLVAAYMTEIGRQVVNGSGASNQMLGIVGTSGVNQASAFGAAATVSTFYTKLAGQLSAVETTRFYAPSVIYMHPRRWNWLLSQTDSSSRPLVVPNQNGPYNATGVAGEPIDTPSARPVGSIMGLPVVTDANIPTAQGTGPEDIVIVARKEDLLLWEDGDGMPRQLRFDQTLGNQLTTTLVAYGYAAFTAGRYPTAVGLVGGNAGTAGFGLIAPTF